MIVINLKNKSMRAGKKKLVDKGKPAEDFQIDQTPVTIDLLEQLYKEYKYSIPVDVKFHNEYFKALPLEEMPDNALILGKSRIEAKINLEKTILMGVLNKSLTWDMFTSNPDHYFWVSPNDKDFIILKEWIV